MQRSITNQKSIATKIVYVFVFAIYESLTSIYLFLPPLFGILFLLFANALRDEDPISLLFITLCLVIFEADKGYVIFSSIIFFALAYKLILPKIEQNFNCLSCIKSSYIFIAYVGFFLFSLLLSKILFFPEPSISYYIIYYIVIELLIVSLL